MSDREDAVGAALSLTRWLLRFQSISVAIVALTVAVCFGGVAGSGVLLGGLLGIALTFYSALRALVVCGPQPMDAVHALSRAEVWKFAGAIIFFGLAAKFWPQGFLPLIVGYMATLPAYWFALLKAPPTPNSHS